MKEHNKDQSSYTIKFVPVQFELAEYEKGQDELNQSISQGWRIVTEYQTASGIVFSLTKSLDNQKNNPEQQSMDDYCVDSIAGGSQK
ncbi:MAG: hypothetical protein HOB51_02380 [Thaumarchaeota archaeon]|jgi:hypothetical protein|nr:hypothetical protein [Nitrososphaerota archaeon]